MATKPPRKRDGDERRRELCDAAIQVLSELGSRGLTHGQVDRQAGLPGGSTSYYYRTRVALLRGIGKRLAEIDVANLRSVIEAPLNPESPFAWLAELTLLQADGRGLMLNRARHELLLAASRDPDLAATTAESIERMDTLTREAVAQLRPRIDDPDLLAAQTSAVMTFIAGLFVRMAASGRTIYSTAQLARLLEEIATAVSSAGSGAHE